MTCLFISKAWVYHSRWGPSQQEDYLWDSTATLCGNVYGVTRGSEEIRSTWNCVSRSCQTYLAASESVIQNLPCGRTIEEFVEQLMELYCSRAGTMEMSGKF